MAALAGTQDVANLWRTLTVSEEVTVSDLLDRVSALIRSRISDIDARILGSPNLDVLARGVAADAVLRVMRNPHGFVSEAIGAASYRRADAVADGALYITDSEWLLLLPTAPPSGAFTIRPGASS